MSPNYLPHFSFLVAIDMKLTLVFAAICCAILPAQALVVERDDALILGGNDALVFERGDASLKHHDARFERDPNRGVSWPEIASCIHAADLQSVDSDRYVLRDSPAAGNGTSSANGAHSCTVGETECKSHVLLNSEPKLI